MSIATPTPGSFLVFTEQVLGPSWTFVAGWIFWFSSVLTMSSEVTAAAIFTRYWFPHVPLWVWSLFYSAFIIAINFISVRGFGTVENILAGVKTIAVLAFLVIGTATWQHWIAPVRPLPSLSTQFGSHGGLLPHGWRAAVPTMILVLFSYAGTGVIGMAAAEAKYPEVTLGQAIRNTVWLITIMYLGSVFLLLALVPWQRESDSVSPFVLALHVTPIPYISAILNVILLFAVLSTMNAALYSNVRVLYALAKGGEAPAGLARLNRRGQPSRAIWTSAGLLGLTIILAYVLPHKAYAYLVTATGFQAMFIWLMVLLTQLYYRPYLEKHHPERLTHKLRGYPYTTYFVMVMVMAAMALSLIAHSELVGALAGLIGILLTVAIWFAVRHRLKRSVSAPES
jgi:AAT family amino acid transporter